MRLKYLAEGMAFANNNNTVSPQHPAIKSLYCKCEHPPMRQCDYKPQASFALHQRLQTGQQDSWILFFFFSWQWNLTASRKTSHMKRERGMKNFS